MGNLVNRDYEPTLAQAGDTVNVPIAPQLTANNLADEHGTRVTRDSRRQAESKPWKRADCAEYAR